MKKPSRLITWPLILIFLYQDIGWTVPAPQLSAISHQLSAIFIPEQYGRIEKSPVPTLQPQVILIKDAHCNYEAQRNIAKILDILISEYKIDLVGIEGAYGKIDPTVIANCPDKKRREDVADKYLKGGWLSASEALALEKGSEYGFTIWGVEDLNLYLNDLKIFRDVYNKGSIANRFIALTKGPTSTLKNKLYPQDALDFDKRIGSYIDGDLKLTELIEYLYSTRRDRFLKYTNLRLIIKAVFFEKATDFSKVEYERSSLIRYLENNLPKEEIKELVKNSLLYKLGKLSSIDYYTYLKGLIPPDDYKRYLNLYMYTNTIRLHSQLDEDGLFKELDLLIEDTYRNCIKDELSWRLHEIDKEIGLLNKLSRLEITRGELQKGIDLTKITEFLKIQCRIHDIPIPPEFTDTGFLTQAEDFYRQPSEFYRYAIERDRAITENLLTKMEKEDKDRAVLVVGGFHADGIERLLKERDIEVIVITPSITKEDIETKRIYLSRMMDERIQPERMLEEIGINNLAEPRLEAVDSPWWEAFAGIIDRINNDLLRDRLKATPSLDAAVAGLTQSDISSILEFLLTVPPDTPGREILIRLIFSSYEEDINETITRIREIEDKEDASGLYREVEEKINRLQELYREYEGFIRDTGQTDERSDFLIMIPSCNRPNDLARLLESLYRELEVFGYATNRRIHIVVVDDSTMDDSSSTYEQIIKDFENRFKTGPLIGHNVSVRLYSRREQRQIIRNLRVKGIDMSFFINKTPEDENFGGKGYAGVRNMTRIITAIEMERVFGDAQNPLVLHVDDDMAFGNPLKKTVERLTNDEDRDRLDRTHIFNYFTAVDMAFKENPGLRSLGGSYTIHDGTLATPEGKECIYYGGKKIKLDARQPKRELTLGGNYITTGRFELESIPFIPGEHRCEDIITGGITKGRRLNRIALAHYQSLQRDIPKGIVDEIVGRAIIDFFQRQLGIPILPSREEREEKARVADQTTGMEELHQIIDTASRLSLPQDVNKFSYSDLVRNMIKELGRKFGLPPYKDKDRFTKEILSFSMEWRFLSPSTSFERGRERAPPEIDEYFVGWESEIEGVDKKYTGEWNERLSTMKNMKQIENFIDRLIRTLGDNIEETMLILRLLFKKTLDNETLAPEIKTRIIKAILGRFIMLKELYFKKKVLEAQGRFRETLLETGQNLGTWQRWNKWRAENRNNLVTLEKGKTPPLAIITGSTEKEKELTKKTSWKVIFGPALEEIIFRGYPFIIGQVLTFFVSPLSGIIGNLLVNLISSVIFVSLHERASRRTAIIVSIANVLLSTALFPLGINFWGFMLISTVIHALINTYILAKQMRKAGREFLGLDTVVRQLTWRDRTPAFAAITEGEVLQNIVLTHGDASIDINISQSLLEKKDIIEDAFRKILKKHPDIYSRLKGINIVLEEDVDYLIGIGKDDIKINRLMLDIGDELLMDIIEYGMESILTGEGDKIVLREIIEIIIYEYEKDIDGTVIKIRDREAKGEDVEDLYKKVSDKMRNIQRLYRVYEDFVVEGGLEDTRDDFMIMIPSCDRPHDLKRLLDSLYRELDLFGYAKNRRIHIVVVDDSGVSDFEGTYITIIDRFRKKFRGLGNITVKFYNRDEQRNIIENLRLQGVDIGFFVNEKQALEKGFGYKGYAGIRNMLKIISAIEQEEHFSARRSPLILHVDDDMRFSNPLRKPKKTDKLLVEELDEQHIFNYFNKVSRHFERFNRTQKRRLPILSGNYTGRAAYISNILENRFWFYHPLSEGEEMKQIGQLVGGHYISDAEFDIDSIPLVPTGIRGEDMFLASLTGARITGGLTLSHHQSLVRSIDRDLLNDFEGTIFIILLYRIASFLANNKESNGWDKWELIKEEISNLMAGDVDEDLRYHLDLYWQVVLGMLENTSKYFTIGKNKSAFVNELISYYYEKGLKDSMKEEGLKEYLDSWPEDIFEIELDRVKLEMIKEVDRADADKDMLLDKFLADENDGQRRIYILRALLKNIFEDSSMDGKVREGLIAKILERILSEKDLFLKGRIIEKQKEFLEKMTEMSTSLEAWRKWDEWRKGKSVNLRTLRERAKKGPPESIGKDVDFEIEGNRIRINAPGKITAPIELDLTEAVGIDAERTLELARELYAGRLNGFIDFLNGILSQKGRIMLFNGTNESRAIGAFAHMRDGKLYIDDLLLDKEIGGMTIIHEALHAFLFNKTLSELTEYIDKITDERIKRMIYTKAEPYRGESDKYLAYLRHYYARYYLQNSLKGGYNGLINERFTYHLRLNAVSNMLGIEPAELDRILAGADAGTTIEYRNRLLNILKRDGNITSDELRIIMESADKVTSIIDLIRGAVSKRINDIREVLSIHIAMERLEEREREGWIPQFINELIDGLSAYGVDLEMAKGVVMELYKLDAYSVVDDNLVISPYYRLMLEGIMNMFGIGRDARLFDRLDRYQQTKALAINRLKVGTTGDVEDREEARDIVSDYIRGKDQAVDKLEKLARIISLYKIGEEIPLEKGGIETILKRINLPDVTPAITDIQRDIDNAGATIGDISNGLSGIQGLYYLDRSNGGPPVFNEQGIIDRLDSGSRLDINGLREFMDRIGREYMLLEKGKEARLLNALYGYKLLEILLENNIPVSDTEWPSNIPLVIEARLLVGDVIENPDGTFSIQSLGEPSIGLIKRALQKGQLKILYSGREKDAVVMWLLEHGVRIDEEAFITEYPQELIESSNFGVSMLTEGTTKSLRGLSDKHRIISGRMDENDLLLMSRMAVILGGPVDKETIGERFNMLYKAYYQGTLGEEEIARYVASAVGAIQSGVPLIIELPKIVPFIKPFYNTLKQTREVVGSAA